MAITNDDVWAPIEAFFDEMGKIPIQTESFNDFVKNGIEAVIRGNDTVSFSSKCKEKDCAENATNGFGVKPQFCEKHARGMRVVDSPSIIFGEIFIDFPRKKNGELLYPKEAIDDEKTYGSDIFCNVEIHDGTERKKNVCIGTIPIMVGSCLCNTKKIGTDDKYGMLDSIDDPGGYFIVNGSKKVVISPERDSYDAVKVHIKKIKQEKNVYAEIRSSATIKTHTTKTQLISNGEKLFVILPSVEIPIPLFIVFRALGVIEEENIMDMIGGDNKRLIPSIENAFSVRDERSARIYIGQQAKRTDAFAFGTTTVENELFPHIDDKMKKAYFMGYMVKRFLDVKEEKHKKTDRDSYANRRIDSTGVMMKNLFYNSWKKIISYTLKQYNDRKNPTLSFDMIKSKFITDLFRSSLATGNWGKKVGVSQLYDDYNAMAKLACSRKISNPLGQKGGKVLDPRRLHTSGFGFVCCAETPEGEHCGLTKSFALTCRVSPEIDPDSVIYLMGKFDHIDFPQENMGEFVEKTKVMVNGNWLWSTGDPNLLVDDLRKMRRGLEINPDISIVHDRILKEVRVYTEPGRMIRPLFVVENGELLIKKEDLNKNWNDLVGSGLIEYLDTDEVNSSDVLIAMFPESKMTKKHTHCELHPSMMFGVGASVIPFPDHNQSPRNVYQASMGKQSVGVPSTNLGWEMTGSYHSLWYPQRPLCGTKSSKLLGYNELPCGQNAIVGILSGDLNNQEDSVAINLSSVQRGLFVSDHHTHYGGKIHEGQELGIPTRTRGNISKLSNMDGTFGKMRWVRSRHEKIPKGIIQIGKVVEKGDVLIGVIERAGTKEYDKSIIYDEDEPGIVDKIFYGLDANQYKSIKIKIISVRIPELGDKWASRHGQKGTCGMLYRQEDLPFNPNPNSAPYCDIYINPLAIPSRMTIGHLIECIKGKKCTVYGSRDTDGDATPFSGSPIEEISKDLKELGYQSMGYERFIDGRTGTPLKALVFSGPTYYQRLKHMVRDKIHARSRGKFLTLTRQPAEGRANDGGFRIGEMERDNFIGQGASEFVVDRLMHSSDKYRCHVCKICGLIAKYDTILRKSTCTVCEDDDTAEITIPYATKLLIQELAGSGIAARILFKKDEEITIEL